MICECGGILFVIRVEEPPNTLSKQEKLVYNRLCDVQCQKCDKVYFSQPYDFGQRLNIVKDLSKKEN
ncbi:hypothetical protein EIZ39_01265 [Ammoniphilus sp. CFH 90114]|nr:hypothetical protein EIZ39_01265 [Ammoniphilus sp. CFH 90114]